MAFYQNKGFKVAYLMPKEIWKTVIDCQDEESRERFLKRVLKTRKRFIEIGLNAVIYRLPRAMVRDYLRETHF
jgi:hypothetical protein